MGFEDALLFVVLKFPHATVLKKNNIDFQVLVSSILLPPPERLCFWSSWFVCLSVRMSVRQIT